MTVAATRVPDHWSHRERSVASPSARALLFTMLGEYVLPGDGAAWAGALVRGLMLLGVEEKAARQAIARTSADGYISRERLGKRVRCHLTPRGHELLAAGAHRIYSFGGSQERWDGRWLLLLVDESSMKRDQRRRLRTRLAWAGIGQIQPGHWVGAHVDREDEAATVLRDLGVAGDAFSFVARSGEIGEPADLIARAWDLTALEERYEDFIATFEKLRPSDGDDAFVALTHLVHAWRHFPFLDPGLPKLLLPKLWSGDRARALFDHRRNEWSKRAIAAFNAYGGR